MLLHSAGSSAPAAWGRRTEIAPTVAPHRNRSPAARAMTRRSSAAPAEMRALPEPGTAATSVLSADRRSFPSVNTRQVRADLAGDARARRAQGGFAVHKTLYLGDEAVVEAPYRGAVFAGVAAVAGHRLAPTHVDPVAEVEEFVRLELQLLGRQCGL